MDMANRWQRKKSRLLGIIALLLLATGVASAGCGGEEAAATPTPTSDSQAQLQPVNFPTKPINIMVDGPTGGGSDQWARSIAAAAEKTLGVPVTVTNVVSDGYLEAVQGFLDTPKDGYTLLSIVDIHAAAFARGELDTNPAEDLVPLLVGNVVVSQVYIAAGDQRYSSWDDVVAYARKSPGLTVASAGMPLDLEGISIVNLERAFGVDLERVILQDSQERFNAPIRGTADLLIEQPSDVKALVDAGKLKPILTLWNERIKGFEDVPTAKDKGADFAPLLRIRGLAANKGVPQERLDYLRSALQAAFNSQEFQEDLRERALDLVSYPKDAAAAFRDQVETYEELYRTLGQEPPMVSAPARRVLVVHSYDDRFQWTRDQGQGIVEGLDRMGYREGQDYALKVFLMDTKVTYTSPEEVTQRADMAIDLIEQFKPDLVFVTDDNALREVAVVYTQKHPEEGLPFVFSGINVDPAIYGPILSLERPGGSITGALERIPYREALEFGQRIFPDAGKIVVLADASPSSTSVVNAFKQEYLKVDTDPPFEVLDIIQPKTFAEWKETVEEYQTKADILGIMTYHQLRDEHGKVVPAQQVMDWTVSNSRLPELGMVPEWAEDGLLAAAGNSGFKTGIYVGVLGGEILDGRDPGTVPIVDPREMDTAFNLDRARMLGVRLPAGELVEAAAVYHDIGGRTTLSLAPVPDARDKSFRLTILHNGGGQSKLINAGEGVEDFGGVARFAAVVQELKTEGSIGPSRANGGTIIVSAGNNIHPGLDSRASLLKGAPGFYDAVAMGIIGYDAIGIGHTDFEFTPDGLADFISGFASPIPFVSSNLDVGGEPRLQALESTGRITRSVLLEVSGERIGILGVTSPRLQYISIPGNAVVDPDLAGAVQTQVNALEAQGINKIILLSDLPGLGEDLSLASQLRGVDIIVANGGAELLANPGNLLLPGDAERVFGAYPLTTSGADDQSILIVTAGSSYSYVGRLIVEFDSQGEVVDIDDASGLVRVAGGANPDAVQPDSRVQAQVTEPVKAFVDALATRVVGSTDVSLDGRTQSVRSQQTNQGKLIADALLWQATQLAGQFDAPIPTIGIQNGGGIRNDSIIRPGNITEMDTIRMVPYADYVVIVPNVSPAQLKEILENAVSKVESTDGRFAQTAGFRMNWDPLGIPRQLDAKGKVVTPGSRVRSVVLDDGTEIVRDGQVVAGAPALSIATSDFLARGGDQYPFGDVEYIDLGIGYQQALVNYIQEGLDGQITGRQYGLD